MNSETNNQCIDILCNEAEREGFYLSGVINSGTGAMQWTTDRSEATSMLRDILVPELHFESKDGQYGLNVTIDHDSRPSGYFKSYVCTPGDEPEHSVQNIKTGVDNETSVLERQNHAIETLCEEAARYGYQPASVMPVVQGADPKSIWRATEPGEVAYYANQIPLSTIAFESSDRSRTAFAVTYYADKTGGEQLEDYSSSETDSPSVDNIMASVRHKLATDLESSASQVAEEESGMEL